MKASGHIEIENGVLTVRHTDKKGPILIQRDICEGEWDTIFQAFLGSHQTLDAYTRDAKDVEIAHEEARCLALEGGK